MICVVLGRDKVVKTGYLLDGTGRKSAVMESMSVTRRVSVPLTVWMLIFNTATLAVVVVVKRVIAMLIEIVYICHKLSLQFACDGNTFLSVMGVESVVVSSHELISSSKDGYDKRIVDELVSGLW